MSPEETLKVDRQLIEAWQRTLPTTLVESDEVKVSGDASDSSALRITIVTAGHSEYSFDFVCRYVDTREVRVELIDVQQGDVSVDERTDVIQTLIEDYIRHIHECTQVLHQLTNR